MRKRLLVLCMAALFVAFFSSVASLADETGPSCTIAFDQSSVSAGSEAFARVTFSGGSTPYRQARYSWEVSDEHGNLAFLSNGSLLSGVPISCTPMWGKRLMLSVCVTDSAGQPWYFNEDIPITGAVDNPVQCAISADKNSVAAGETVTATATFSDGLRPYRSARYSWQVSDEYGNLTFISNGTLLSGARLSASSMWGRALTLFVSVTDQLGQPWYFEKTFQIIGAENNPVQCIISTDKDSVATGETVTATAAFSGGKAPYRQARYSWDATDAHGNITSLSSGALLSGIPIRCTPTWGKELTLSVTVIDSDGQPWNFNKTIPITGEPIPSGGPSGQGAVLCALSMDQPSVAVGQEIAATATFSGGVTPYRQVRYTFDAYDGESYSAIIADGTLVSGETVRCTPTWGKELTFSVSIIDGNGLERSFYRTVPITGAADHPPACVIAFDAETVAVDTEAAARVTFSGGETPYQEASYTCELQFGEYDRVTDSDGMLSSGDSVRCTPAFGTDLIVCVRIIDRLCRPWHFERSIPITGTADNPVVCDISFDQSSAELLSEVVSTVTFSGGDAPYREASYSLFTEYAFDTTEFLSAGALFSGVPIRCTPTWGTKLWLFAEFIDGRGRPWHFERSIPLTGVPTLAFAPGSDAVYTPGSPGADGLCVTVPESAHLLDSVFVDGCALDESDYSVVSGSTIITLYPSFLSTLPSGAHVLTAYFVSGYAQMTFSVQPPPADAPETGDRGAALPLLLSVASGTLLILVKRRRAAR